MALLTPAYSSPTFIIITISFENTLCKSRIETWTTCYYSASSGKHSSNQSRFKISPFGNCLQSSRIPIMWALKIISVIIIIHNVVMHSSMSLCITREHVCGYVQCVCVLFCILPSPEDLQVLELVWQARVYIHTYEHKSAASYKELYVVWKWLHLYT